MLITFEDDETGYLDWLQRYPTGLVLNTRRDIDPAYMVLNGASCATISRHRGMHANPGGFTERGYIKVCADGIGELRRWVRSNGRADGTFSKECSLCNPGGG